MLTVPRVDPPAGEAPVVQFDLTQISRAEGRIEEIAGITPGKAPELLATFNSAYAKSARVMAGVQMERVRAQRALERLKSDITLNRVPALLEEKKLKTSVDLREAVIALDPEYQRLQEQCDHLDAIYELMKGKTRALDMAMSSVKRLLGENAFNWKRPGTSAGNEDRPSLPAASSNGFGKANIGR